MGSRYHISIVVTAEDGVSRDEVSTLVGSAVRGLEDAEDIHRAFVEGGGIDEAEAERLLEILSRVSTDDIVAASETMRALSESDEQ